MGLPSSVGVGSGGQQEEAKASVGLLGHLASYCGEPDPGLDGFAQSAGMIKRSEVISTPTSSGGSCNKVEAYIISPTCDDNLHVGFIHFFPS